MTLTPRLLLASLLCALSAPFSLSQSGTPQQPGSIVEGTVIQDPGAVPIRKVVVRLQSTDGEMEGFSSSIAEAGLDETMAVDMAGSLFGRFGANEESAPNQHFTTSTDSSGHFRIEGVPPGQYMVFISRDGFVPKKRKHADLFITVAAGQDLSSLVYKMEAAGFITGKIVDADGDPVSGVAVQAMPKGKPQPENSSMSSAYAFLGAVGGIPGVGTTNDLGEYRISGLRAGQYLVVARPQGNLGPAPSASENGRPREILFYATTYFPGALDQKQANPVQVLPGSAASVTFTLQTSRAYRVSGTVAGVSRSGSIMLLSTRGQPLQQSFNETGRFDFQNVQSGTYIAQIFEQPAEGSTNEQKMLRVPNPIVVTGSDLTDLVLQPLADGGTLSGRFRADGQDTVDWKQMYVSLLPVSDSTQETAGNTSVVTISFAAPGSSGGLNEDGSFELKSVAPGNYQIAVGTSNPNYRDWYTKSVLVSGRDVTDCGFSVSGGTSIEVIVSAKGPSIDGTVLDSDGKPVPEVLVQSIPSSGKLARPDSYQQAHTDANGHFTLRGLNPGEFIVVALESPQANPRTGDFFDKYATRGTKVELTEGEKKTITVTRIPDDSK